MKTKSSHYFVVLILVTLFSANYQHVSAQVFTEASAFSGLSAFQYGDIEWGDVDNDGDLDLLVTGESTANAAGESFIVFNDAGSFTRKTALGGVEYSQASFVDYNNDGNLDIFLSGINSSNYDAFLYSGNGTGTFILTTAFANNSGSTGSGLYNSSADWADYDNDGDHDLLLTGKSASGAKAYIYVNNGDGTFTQTTPGFVNLDYSASRFLDYDNDNRMDVITSGYDGSFSEQTYVYKQNADGTWTNVTTNFTAVLHQIKDGDIDVLDFDNDGDSDLLISGSAGTKLYQNTAGDYTLHTTFASLSYATVDFGDYDNDGDMDIIVAGDTPQTILYTNSANVFTASSETFHGIKYGDIEFGDYDNDGDLDIALIGYDNSVKNIKLYTNGSVTQNTAPAAPTNLGSTTPIASMRMFSWTAATDAQTTGTLTYNLRIGTTPGSGDILAVPASYSTGYNRTTEPGQIRGLSHIINELPLGTYYWSVQAIDNSFAGGAWAAEQSFVVTPPPAFTEQTGIALTGVYNSSVAWGDYDNDGDLDILLTGYGSGYVSKIYKNTAGQFTEQTDISLTGVRYGSVAWGDYDNDGDLDILLTGSTGSVYVSKIYKNTDGAFAEQTDISLTGVRYSSVAWGDYDNDGDLDILLTGYASSGQTSKIYKNTDGQFAEQTNISLTNVYKSSVAWGDYDNDGDLDILLTGYASSGRVSKIYKNTDGTFAEQTDIVLTPVDDSSVAWGDYDNDGDLDILLTG